ncbi:MAG: transcriptional repressor [Lachnospiraceae bacterium]|nr:transcriptional repressor [Lachnospiraceae bacterium]
MSTRLKYKTRQKEMLIDYLSSVEGEHITANDVCEFFKSQGETIGQSTIYRHLESLVDEGIINKYVIDANSPACFEYMGRESHLAGEVCFHCKCEKCGCLIHLHCDELSEIGRHLYNEHHFKLDPKRTVFYGLCENCVNEE